MVRVTQALSISADIFFFKVDRPSSTVSAVILNL